MNRRRFLTATGFCVTLLIIEHAAAPQMLPKKLPPEVEELLARAIAAHGGDALKNLQTLHEVSETRVSGPMGFHLPTRHYDVWLDRAGGRSRWQSTVGDKPAAIFEQTPDGIFIWTSDIGTQKLMRNEPFLALTPLGGDGLIGLLALTHTCDSVALVENGEIAGKKGRMIVRSQATPVEALVEAGRAGIQRATSQTTWAYLFAPDGTLIAERSVETQVGGVVETQLSFDEFKTFGGIMYPTEIGIKSSLAPKGISIHSSIKQVTLNDPIAASVFRLP